MPFPQLYCVEWLTGHAPSTRRGVAWLVPRPALTEVTGRSEFWQLEVEAQRNLRNRFDWWMNAPLGVTKKEYCHGWDEPKYKNVWVFKYREHRIFGFLCHPDDQDQRFHLCVMCSYTIKEGWEADETLKDLMKDFANNEKLLEAAHNVHERKNCEHPKKADDDKEEQYHR